MKVESSKWCREKVNEQRTAELEEEMSEAWRNRQFALLHALSVEYARTFSPRTVWDREDWIREMSGARTTRKHQQLNSDTNACNKIKILEKKRRNIFE